MTRGRKIDWHQRTIIDGEETTPHAWLEEHGQQRTNAGTAEHLNKHGVKVTSMAVRMKRRNEDWLGGGGEGAFPAEGQITRQAGGGNEVSFSSKGPRVKTLDDLLRACNVDLDVWTVDHYIVNKWEMGSKIEEGLQVEPLYQVKAWLIRKVPVPVFPTIRPVAASPRQPVPLRPTGGLVRTLVWSDPHFGFARDLRTALLDPMHDRRVLDIALQVAVECGANRIDMLGDLLDLAEWTDRFLSSPDFAQTTQPAIDEAHWWLAQFRDALPSAAITVHEGNHGKRMEAAIMRHLRAAYDLRSARSDLRFPLLSVPHLLALDALGIRWVGGYPDDEDWLNDALCLTHGDVARVPGNTAKAVAAAADMKEVFGHIHRIEWVSRTKRTRSGRQVVLGFCPGCTCRVDGTVPGHTNRQQWQQGFAVIDYEENGTLCSIAPVVVEEGRAIWNGRLFEARDRITDLREDHPGWNWG